MSGGVDSSVAALLLKAEGYEVSGATLCFQIGRDAADAKSCCSPDAVDDAKKVADMLQIKHYVFNYSDVFQEKIIDYYDAEYQKARTPNPCIRCNQIIKFGLLLKRAIDIGADAIATGHYANIADINGYPYIRKAKDITKDQSYFLYRVGHDALEKVLLPLGGYLKSEIRQIASANRLSVAEKKESQEVCFISGSALKGKKGQIKDAKGNILGTHKGIAHYTIGQRKGLGISSSQPYYVIAIEAAKNEVIVGKREEAYKKSFEIDDLVLRQDFRDQRKYNTKIRYLHEGADAYIERKDAILSVCFEKEQFAITPGQSAVFYQDDIVMGGGIIEKVHT